MTAFVMDLGTLAVTEHSGAATGVAGQFVTTADGVAVLDETDVTEAGSFELMLSTLTEGGKRTTPLYCYVWSDGPVVPSAKVTTADGSEFSYPSARRYDVHKIVFGKGIESNYLALGLTLPADGPYTVDQLEFVTRGAAARRY